MRAYGKVMASFWSSPEVRSMTDDGRMLALYLLTCGHGNLIGCFRIPNAYVADDMGWETARVVAAFASVREAGFADRNESTGWIFIPRFLRWNPLENPNQRKAATKLATVIPDLSLRSRVLGAIDGTTSETLSEPFRNGSQSPTLASEPEEAKPFRNRFGNPSGTVTETLSKPYQDQEQNKTDADQTHVPACRAELENNPEQQQQQAAPSKAEADKLAILEAIRCGVNTRCADNPETVDMVYSLMVNSGKLLAWVVGAIAAASDELDPGTKPEFVRRKLRTFVNNARAPRDASLPGSAPTPAGTSQKRFLGHKAGEQSAIARPPLPAVDTSTLFRGLTEEQRADPRLAALASQFVPGPSREELGQK